METAKLFMLLLGASPKGRHTEQHDVFFGIAGSLRELVQSINEFWPEARDKLHIDAWQEINYVDGFEVRVATKTKDEKEAGGQRLFFLNLGGYKPGEFEEFHYKMIVAAADKGAAVQQAKKTAFYRHTGFKGASSHIDDKYGVDVDDVFEIKDILSAGYRDKYRIELSPAADMPADTLHLGYFKLDKL